MCTSWALPFLLLSLCNAVVDGSTAKKRGGSPSSIGILELSADEGCTSLPSFTFPLCNLGHASHTATCSPPFEAPSLQFIAPSHRKVLGYIMADSSYSPLDADDTVGDAPSVGSRAARVKNSSALQEYGPSPLASVLDYYHGLEEVRLSVLRLCSFKF